MRYFSNKEKKKLMDELPLGYQVLKKDEIKEDALVVFKDCEKFLIIDGNRFLPHLKSIDEKHYKSVYIDKGAIAFIVNGADLMRPGITKIEDGISKGDVVIVRDQEHLKKLALGFALFSSDEMVVQKIGKSVKIYHYAGDSFY